MASFFSVQTVSLSLAVGHFQSLKPRINLNHKPDINSLAPVVAGRPPTFTTGLALLAIRDKKHFDRSNINANDDILLIA